MENGKQLIEFLMQAGKLKQLPRAGWEVRGIKPVESVASHTYRTALLAALLARDCNVDAEKAVKMALLHDLPEAVCGDTVGRVDEKKQGISNEEKGRMERAAMQQITKEFNEQGEEIMLLWREFEFGNSREAGFVKQLDGLEMALQALEYEIAGIKKETLDEFFEYADQGIKSPKLREIFLKILEMRPSSQKL